jgi:hypothetical protein
MWTLGPDRFARDMGPVSNRRISGLDPPNPTSGYSMFKFLRKTYLWVPAVPLALILLGALSNQLVLWANHDTFPVLANPIVVERMGGFLQFEGKSYLDFVHIVMTPQTHLNFLADVFDFGRAYLSVGDLMLELGEGLFDYSIAIWIFVAAVMLYGEED